MFIFFYFLFYFLIFYFLFHDYFYIKMFQVNFLKLLLILQHINWIYFVILIFELILLIFVCIFYEYIYICSIVGIIQIWLKLCMILVITIIAIRRYSFSYFIISCIGTYLKILNLFRLIKFYLQSLASLLMILIMIVVSIHRL